MLQYLCGIRESFNLCLTTSMSVNWLNLRPFNGSQHTAFEEMGCQLAAAATPPPCSQFIRKGAPDAGIATLTPRTEARCREVSEDSGYCDHLLPTRPNGAEG